MQPTPEHKYRVEVPGSRGEPIDVRLKKPRTGTKYSSCTCDRCKKPIVRGKTNKGKSIPLSQEIDSNGKPQPIAHWEDCKYAHEFRKQNKGNIYFNSNSLF